jgi:hypothetical protein
MLSTIFAEKISTENFFFKEYIKRAYLEVRTGPIDIYRILLLLFFYFTYLQDRTESPKPLDDPTEYIEYIKSFKKFRKKVLSSFL